MKCSPVSGPLNKVTWKVGHQATQTQDGKLRGEQKQNDESHETRDCRRITLGAAGSDL